MTRFLRLIGAMMICGSIASPLFRPVAGKADQSTLTTIKLSNGEVVEGQINGLIVLKEWLRKSETGAKETFTIEYTLIDGKGIEAIDSEGVHLGSNSTLDFISCSQENRPPDDLEALQKGMSLASGAMKFDVFSKGSTLFHTDVKTGNRSVKTGELLGEFRMKDPPEKLIPAIEITTEKGVVKVPVKEIVAFKKKVERPD